MANAVVLWVLVYFCVTSVNTKDRAGHSCETALLHVYNDIVTTVGKGNGSFLVLLDLSDAFYTIDHNNAFYILEKYVGIGGSALRLIRLYFMIVHKEFKLMVLRLIVQVFCVGCHRAQFWDQ